MNVKTQSWSKIRSLYEDWASSGIPVQAILELLAWIRDEKLENEMLPAWTQPGLTEIFATISMTSLIMSDKKNFKHGENMLSVTPMKDKVCFTYSRLDGSNDRMTKIVYKKDAIETFRLILAYKFGIHRKPKPTIKIETTK